MRMHLARGFISFNQCSMAGREAAVAADDVRRAAGEAGSPGKSVTDLIVCVPGGWHVSCRTSTAARAVDGYALVAP